MKYYSGVGSRNTPLDICDKMSKLARILADKQYCLRSGNAKGADQAFFRGLSLTDAAEIFLPYPTFENPNLKDPRFINVQGELKHLISKAESLVKNVHPRWFVLKDYQKKFHIRNVFQVLGMDLETPSEFLVCYAPISGDTVTGGTATAYQIAKNLGIPTFNLYKDSFEDLLTFVSSQ